MNKKVFISLGIILAGFAGLLFYANTHITDSSINYSTFRKANILETIEKNDYASLNPDEILPASELSGNIGEKIVGDPKKAKVVIYEYADYACVHCADWNTVMNKVKDEFGDDLAVVYRGFNLGFKNGTIAASAATAAQIQGCWEEYKNLLFANQGEWSYLSGEKLEDVLIRCFKEASGDEGDVDQFLADMRSEAVGKRLAFEHEMGTKIGLSGTPTFRIDGEEVNPFELKKIVQEKLAEA